MSNCKPHAPQHLSAAVKAWWTSVAREYQLESHHFRLLTLAAEAWDRCEQARLLLASDGIVFRDDRGNVRAHPAVAIERDARTAFARLIRELDLDVEAPRSGRNGPPALHSNRGGA